MNVTGAVAGDASYRSARCGAAPESLSKECVEKECVEAVASLCRVLSDPQRLRILVLLAAQEDAVCVCDLAVDLGRAQPTVTYHLKKLEESGLLDRRADGKWAYYTPTPAAIDVLVCLEVLVTMCGQPPARRSDTRRVLHAS